MKTWSDLYVNIVRLSAMVANTEPNIACEELMSDILAFTDQLSAKEQVPRVSDSICAGYVNWNRGG